MSQEMPGPSQGTSEEIKEAEKHLTNTMRQTSEIRKELGRGGYLNMSSEELTDRDKEMMKSLFHSQEEINDWPFPKSLTYSGIIKGHKVRFGCNNIAINNREEYFGEVDGDKVSYEDAQAIYKKYSGAATGGEVIKKRIESEIADFREKSWKKDLLEE